MDVRSRSPDRSTYSFACVCRIRDAGLRAVKQARVTQKEEMSAFVDSLNLKPGSKFIVKPTKVRESGHVAVEVGRKSVDQE